MSWIDRHGTWHPDEITEDGYLPGNIEDDTIEYDETEQEQE